MNELINAKKLAVVDFGRTLIVENDDIVVRGFLQDRDYGCYKPGKRLWIEYMEAIFAKLHAKTILKTSIVAKVKSIRPMCGFKKLIRSLVEDLNFDVVVVSGSNQIFVEEWLRCAALDNCVCKVISNPAEFDETGRLHVRAYTDQNVCPLSPRNFCKGAILEQFVCEQKSKNIHYANVIYVGDSTEDFCPILRLSSNDIAFCRAGHGCDMMIELNRKRQPALVGNSTVWPEVKANVFFWVSGDDILLYLKNYFGFYKY